MSDRPWNEEYTFLVQILYSVALFANITLFAFVLPVAVLMYLFNMLSYINEYLGLIGGKLIFAVGERRGRDPVCAFAQTDRRLCLSLFMGGSREGDETGDPGPLRGHKNIGVLSNAGPGSLGGRRAAGPVFNVWDIVGTLVVRHLNGLSLTGR